MESDLRCNNLNCRKVLIDKAVVTTCSHIFCVDCANTLFTAAQLCPACEASLNEPDDVVVASLRPTNDYKTSVLSGLSPAVVLEICGRAIAFWQYQVHQEGSYQQAILKSLNDKISQISKQLENVVREANGELNLMSNKVAGLERELELERRKNRDVQAVSREKDKEYQKLKNQFDKIKRKTLLGSTALTSASVGDGAFASGFQNEDQTGHLRHNNFRGPNIGQAAEGMDTSRVQRTPINHNRTTGIHQAWPSQPTSIRTQQHLPTFRTGSISENSENEVDNLLGQRRRTLKPVNSTIYTGYIPRDDAERGTHLPVLQNPSTRMSGGFRPADFVR